MPDMNTSYDEIPYRSNPFPQTHPTRLAAMAGLFGLDAPPADNCRVLELGCSSGGNLVAMAQIHPGSRFLGIDASARQVADGWRVIDTVGLKNVELRHKDILEVGEDFGAFDYIVSHGVFSWVPPAVQDRMIEICRRHLVPNGVAFISYNTYPGWHIRGIVRDMMRFHGGQFADPATRLAQAKALVEFVVNSSTAKDSPYERLLRSELDFIGKHDDYYLHHDHLEQHNLPLYFHQFARKLAVNGLQYLGDADFVTMVSTNFAPEVAQTLQKLGAHDIVQMEQYMDYVRCRYFRQTLICHRAAQLNRHLGPDTVKKFFLATNAAPAKPDPSLAPTDAEQFKTPGGVGVTCQSPLTKLALLTPGRQWPMPVAFADLFARCKAEAARKGYPADSADAENVFAGQLLTCMAAGLIEWRLTPAPFTTTISERPAVTPLARFQASEGPHVTNLRGENATLDEFHRQVVSRLDGTRNREQLIEEIMAYLKASGHSLHRADTKTPITDEKEMRSLLDTMVDKAFQNLAKLAVLIPEKKT